MAIGGQTDLAARDAEVGEVARLRAEVARLRAELDGLRGVADAPPATAPSAAACPRPAAAAAAAAAWDGAGHGLSAADVSRYSRQIILPSFGAAAQARLRAGSALVVGAGGLGSPALLYLAAAGVGRLGVADRDAVELSNLHRQVLHPEAAVGAPKTASAAAALAAANSGVAVAQHAGGVTPANAAALAAAYDVVLDASDNAATRYLLSDACAAARTPLVSGAAVGADGQLTVYCAAAVRGGRAPGGEPGGEPGAGEPRPPCYRCLFPAAAPPAGCQRCADAGVLGPVPGVVGVLQALEAVKLLAGVGRPLAGRLLVVDGLDGRFTTVRLRGPAPGCAACGDAPAVTAAAIARYDYAAFTGQPACDGPPPPLALLPAGARLSPAQLRARLDDPAARRRLVLLDVRPAEQYDMCRLPGSLHVPLRELGARLGDVRAALAAAGGEGGARAAELVAVCRRGNDSQRAVARLRREPGLGGAVDLAGGLEAWAEVDAGFPRY